ncbi:hypothetical protein ACFQY7_12985 [Actinomadura luteofluorescens]|uniref:hypothetical protein n=1 Tax=Actinomadura luteofluorescens TaxID=46163 RepID=UPI00363CDC62
MPHLIVPGSWHNVTSGKVRSELPAANLRELLDTFVRSHPEAGYRLYSPAASCCPTTCSSSTASRCPARRPRTTSSSPPAAASRSSRRWQEARGPARRGRHQPDRIVSAMCARSSSDSHQPTGT